MKMKKTVGCTLLSLLFLFFALCPCSALTEDTPYVEDDGGYLTKEEEQQLNDYFKNISGEYQYYFYSSYFELRDWDFEQFLLDKGHTSDDNVLILGVYPKIDGTVGYNLAVYGAANRNLTDKEYNIILDDPQIYDHIKAREVYTGASALPQVSATYLQSDGNDGSVFEFINWKLLLIVAAVVFLITFVSLFIYVTVTYQRKVKSSTYPMDEFTKTDITDRQDRFLNKRVVVVQTKSSDNHSSSGGFSSGGTRGGGR